MKKNKHPNPAMIQNNMDSPIQYILKDEDCKKADKIFSSSFMKFVEDTINKDINNCESITIESFISTIGILYNRMKKPDGLPQFFDIHMYLATRLLEVQNVPSVDHTPNQYLIRLVKLYESMVFNYLRKAETYGGQQSKHRLDIIKAFMDQTIQSRVKSETNVNIGWMKDLKDIMRDDNE